MSILFNRGLVLAKLESVFATDAVPTATLTSFTAINATSSIDDTTEVITSAAHGIQAGDGPFRASLTSGAFPTGIDATTDYYLAPYTAGTPANEFRVFTTRANAIAGTSPVDMTNQTGVFALTLRVSDALLVEDPDVSVDPTTVERNNVSSTLSNDPIRIARKTLTVTFAHEIRGNGVTDGSLPPALGRLFRGCGYSETSVPTGTGTILSDAPVPVNDPTGVFTYAKTTGYAGTLPRIVVLQCTTGGGSGVAEFTVYSPAVGAQAAVNSTGNVLTEASAFDLAESAQITVPASGITTNFAVGDTYAIWLGPPGHTYYPVSTGFESLTLYVYFDGLLHKGTGCRGTFNIEGEGANLARANFTFQGSFEPVVDAAQPSAPVLESSIPPAVELANVTALGGKDFDATNPTEFNLCAASFNVDAGSELNFQECINAADSIEGAILTGRDPVGGFDPEATLEATHPFWGILSEAQRVAWQVRVGKTQGNTMSIFGPYTQYSDLGYTNRNETRAYDVGLFFAKATDAGNDEVGIHLS